MQNDQKLLSAQIDFLRFTVIVGLVFLHYGEFPTLAYDPYGGFSWGASSLPQFVNSYFYFFFLSAVPVLSAISGYLFFKEADFSASFYKKRYRSRMKSIFLPMVSWNAIALLLSTVVVLTSATGSKLVAYDTFNLTPMDLLNALVGVTQRPADFQFWFLHDLLLTVLISPLLGFMIRRLPMVGLLCLFMIWIFNPNLIIFFRTDVLFFFYVGAMARIQNWPILNIASFRTAAILMLTYAVLVGVRLSIPSLLSGEPMLSSIAVAAGNRILRLCGVLALWSLVPYLVRTTTGAWIAKFGAFSFFLHAIHWPLNQLIKQGISIIVPDSSDAALLTNFFGTTLMTVAVAIFVALLLNAVAPSVFNHLSGGRSTALLSRFGKKPIVSDQPLTAVKG